MRPFVTIALLTLAACSPPAATNGGKSDPAGASPMAASFAPERALIGRWGDNGDCSNPLVINADGSFESGGRLGKRTLDGNHLTMSGAGGVFVVDLGWEDADHMRVMRPDGSVGHSQRCA